MKLFAIPAFSVIQSLQLCKAKVDGSEVARFLNRTSILN